MRVEGNPVTWIGAPKGRIRHISSAGTADLMMRDVIGRQQELASIVAFLDGPVEEPAAFVLEGEAGIGKSTLWLAAVEAARERGFLVLSSRPAEVEIGLAHIGLGDLFEEVLDDLLPALATPRRQAVEVALLRKDASGDAVDHRALAVAVRDMLQGLSESNRVLLAVDDVQWLDRSSSSALSFALRRLGAKRVLVLLARRLFDGAEPSELESALAADRVQRLPVGALSVGALHRLLHGRFERSFARQTLLRIHEQSGGNPFFALELARVVDVEIGSLESLPVPETLEELVCGRLAGLPAATRDALALTAALGAPSESLLERVGVAADALAPADAAGVIERENGVVRFTHPLLASSLYRHLGEQRRGIHARIAGIVDDAVVRARHLALSRNEPDSEIAGVLDDAATLAAERGASNAAADLAEHALRLTPSDARGERHRRALAAARAHHVAGEWTRAKMIATELLAERCIGPLRAEALLLLAELEGLGRGVALLEEALSEADSRPALQAQIHCQLAWTARHTKGFVGALEHARTALELADVLDDDALRVGALAMLTVLGCAVGDADAPSYAARALDLATASGNAELLRAAAAARAGVLAMHRDVDGARAALESDYEELRERDELGAATVLGELADVELWGGRWQLAADYAASAYELKTQYGLEAPWDHLPIAVIAAHRGQLEVARMHSERALQLGEEQIGLHTPIHLGTMGIVALQSGDSLKAVEWFDKAAATTGRLGWHEAGHRWWTDDYAEALLERGRIDDALRILDAWEADARRLGREWVLARVTRCRGLVAAAHGDVDEAASLLEDAVSQHETVGDAFGKARALLALGVARRRARQKRAARDAIGAALVGFEELGAATWVEKARRELGRIGGRTREEGLTAAERRVAALVAEGRTNREVAAALFVGERTVETHLSHVYAKLGVRSRTELARKFRSDEQSSGGLAISS